MQIVGMDIGYSNLKLAYGDSDGSASLAIRPAGAAPIENIGHRIMGSDDSLRVLVDGREFVSAVSHDRIENWPRELHKDYASTDSYRALFHAGLLLSEQTEIDLVVTGLPTNQYFDEELRNRLARTLTGEHQITAKKNVLVRDVKIVPQPLGGFVDYLNGLSDPDQLEDASVLVVDPGFFSVDWVLLMNGEFKRASSGTSLDASSVILDKAADMIAVDFGGNPGRSKLENAIRAGRSTVTVFGERVEVAKYLDAASAAVGHIVCAQLQESLRKEDAAIDAIVLVGGGAPFYQTSIKEVFGKTPVTVAANSVFANVRGFWLGGAAK